MELKEFEIFKFSDNKYEKYYNNGIEYNLNRHPYLDIVLTDYCNQNCSFCIANLIKKKKSLDIDLAIEKVKFAIDNLNITEVLLLGGEPTMYENLVPFIQRLAKLKLDKIIMTSNGIKLARNRKFALDVMYAGLTNLNVSFMNTDPALQAEVTSNKIPLTVNDIKAIGEVAKAFNVNFRINTNVYRYNNDTTRKMYDFYIAVEDYVTSVKFSPLVATDNFSVLNVTTEWVKANSIKDELLDVLFNSFEQEWVLRNTVAILENNEQFGFVKNTMIPLQVPIIMNWNFGEYTGMMDKVVNEHKINNIKLLSNGELSLSWNRDCTKYYIDTN